MNKLHHKGKEKKIKKLYLLDPKIKWKSFKILQEHIKDSGPTPVHMDKMLWQMLRDKKIHLWFSDEMMNDMGIGLEVPPYENLFIIKNV